MENLSQRCLVPHLMPQGKFFYKMNKVQHYVMILCLKNRNESAYSNFSFAFAGGACLVPRFHINAVVWPSLRDTNAGLSS